MHTDPGLSMPYAVHAILTSCNWAADRLRGGCAGPVVQAARLPLVCPMALGYGLPPM